MRCYGEVDSVYATGSTRKSRRLQSSTEQALLTELFSEVTIRATHKRIILCCEFSIFCAFQIIEEAVVNNTLILNKAGKTF
jgi:hypothetical protein